MTYFIRDYSEHGKEYTSVEHADTPKKAIKQYLRTIWEDNVTIRYVRKTRYSKGADFKVLCTEKNTYHYYVIM